VPDGTAELVLLCEDLDAPSRTFVHWLVTGIDPTSTGVAEGQVPAGGREWTNAFGEQGWGGSQPPVGDRPHRYFFSYFFSLYALRAARYGCVRRRWFGRPGQVELHPTQSPDHGEVNQRDGPLRDRTSHPDHADSEAASAIGPTAVARSSARHRPRDTLPPVGSGRRGRQRMPQPTGLWRLRWQEPRIGRSHASGSARR
jgi:hypothetical protein